MDNLFIAMVLGRQIDGEYVFARAERVFKQASKADSFAKTLKNDFCTADGKAKPISITAPDGTTATCMCEVAVFPVEFDEGEN